MREQETLIHALLDPACYPHAVDRIALIETHISYVLLTGPYAYKIKKAVNLGFLDFTTAELRHFFCEEELRLNRRLAPRLYLDVIPIGGTPQEPKLGAEAGAFEFAVKMRQFAQEGLLDRVLYRGALTVEHVDAIAAIVAAFHQRIECARPAQDYGGAAGIESAMRQNFVQIRGLLATSAERESLALVEAWSLAQHATLLPLFAQRHEQRFIRECHGDLHLGNIALVDGAIQVFDCIEFNPALRWIDVINEIAFLVMDLAGHGQPDLAWRFLNAYLQETGDYAGLRLLNYYQIYRAMVRAKVARIRTAQAHLRAEDRKLALDSYAVYTGYASRVTAPPIPGLIITHGLSGSGKTAVTQLLLQQLGAVRVRSDIERKRLQHLAPQAKSGAGIDSGIYIAAATHATYAELRRLAGLILDAGCVAIVDATFLRRWQRDSLHRLAAERNVPFVIVSCLAEDEELRRRLLQREHAGQDASEATLEVLAHQLATQEPLEAEERAFAVIFDSEREPASKLQRRVSAALQAKTAP
ncbi:MAG: aminoglycoside phosphotransferase [Nitrosomonadales bacterium]|nr:MAG: aminoglycoside phosphotransferase [Nitrosomonadales bacterium]